MTNIEEPKNILPIDLLTMPATPQETLRRRLLTHPKAMYYNRFIILVVLCNLCLFLYGATVGDWWRESDMALHKAAKLALLNISVAILLRQPHIINLLFALATGAPKSWPLAVRRRLGKVYHFGGAHVGGALMGTLWFLVFVAVFTADLVRGTPSVPVAVTSVSYVIMAILLVMCFLALPKMRARWHDHFERSHRFGGWTALALLWVQTLLLLRDSAGNAPFGHVLVTAPDCWMLLAITGSIALPWLSLRKVAVTLESPSPHVVLVRLHDGSKVFPGSTSVISRQPFLEWHAFANVSAPNEEGVRLVISRAGDWTGQFIDDLPSHVWMRSIPTAGMATVASLFHRVVWIATGSGIGPTLPHLLAEG